MSRESQKAPLAIEPFDMADYADVGLVTPRLR